MIVHDLLISAKMVHCAENIVQFYLVKSKRSLQISNVYPSVLLSLTLICDVIWQGFNYTKVGIITFCMYPWTLESIVKDYILFKNI